MINELYGLSDAMERSGIEGESWHRMYKLIPNVKEKAPCVCIVLSEGRVVRLYSVNKELGSVLRKYATNQGSYPCMNLAPLYNITDGLIKKELEQLRPEELTSAKIDEIKSWCVNNNWMSKFQSKYRRSMEKMPHELAKLVPDYTPLQVLVKESDCFIDYKKLHEELSRAAFEMLSNRENVSLALKVLFCYDKADEDGEEKKGTLSVALEAQALIDMGTPAVSRKFTVELNEALLRADPMRECDASSAVDAFGISFEPIEEPMPEIKLAGGFDVKLRTMFKEQRCQTRYARIENASYPISPQMRKKLASALNWLGSAENKDYTWIKTDKNEILFAYPSQLPEKKISFTRMFKRPENSAETFLKQANTFITELRKGRREETGVSTDSIRLFILRKIDKARTKIIYSRQTDLNEMERRCEEWDTGCSKNLPSFPFGKIFTPFPINTAGILNRFWKQNGEISTDKFKPVPGYHGMELLMEADLPVTPDMHSMAEKAMTIAGYLGKLNAIDDTKAPIWSKINDVLALMGLLLYRVGIVKEKYMKNLPYLYGQLLKASDELHALYCKVVRKGEYPQEFVGGSLFRSAAEAPVRTLNLLSHRIMPYYSWAKSYRAKSVEEKGEESWRAGWMYSTCETIMTKLREKWTPQTRFTDEEKAQLFIGYLAAFPKKEKTDRTQNNEKENDNEQ